MGTLPGFVCNVLRNGNKEAFTNVKISQQTSRAGINWSVNIPKPVEIADDDAWTIQIGLAGYIHTFVDYLNHTSLSGSEDKDKATVTVEGNSTELEDLLSYCIPKTICFVNQAWITKLYPSAKIVNDVLMNQGERILHPRLPGKEFQEGSFKCVLGPRTHREASEWLCQQVGFKLWSNTPDLNIIDTLTINSGTPWFDGIKNPFLLWGAIFEIRKDMAGKSTIYVQDVLKENGSIDSRQKLSIRRPALISHSYKPFSKRGSSKIVDHVIITGRTSKDTLMDMRGNTNLEPITIQEVPVEPNLTVITETNLNDRLSPYQRSDVYTGQIGKTGKGGFTPDKLQNEYRITQYRVEGTSGRKKYVPVQEDVFLYGTKGIVSKHVMNHYYGEHYKPIRTKEQEYVYDEAPPRDMKAGLSLVREKTVIQDQFVKSLNLTLTSEIVDQIVVYDEVTTGGETTKNDPVPYMDIKRQDYSRDALTSGAAKPSNPQRTMWMTTDIKRTFISRTDEDLLLKVDQNYLVLQRVVKTNSQPLENPHKDVKESAKDREFRREYYMTASGGLTNDPQLGNGKIIGQYGKCYHQPTTISHPDITTDEDAEKVAKRAFAKSANGSDSAYTVTIDTPVPILLDSVGIGMDLEDMLWSDRGDTYIVPGGSFVLKGSEIEVNASGSGNTITLGFKQQLTAERR
jgi:hypothetical protein